MRHIDPLDTIEAQSRMDDYEFLATIFNSDFLGHQTSRALVMDVKGEVFWQQFRTAANDLAGLSPTFFYITNNCTNIALGANPCK